MKKSWVLCVMIGDENHLLLFTSEANLKRKLNEIIQADTSSRFGKWIEIEKSYFRVEQIQKVSYWNIKFR